MDMNTTRTHEGGDRQTLSIARPRDGFDVARARASPRPLSTRIRPAVTHWRSSEGPHLGPACHYLAVSRTEAAVRSSLPKLGKAVGGDTGGYGASNSILSANS